MSNESRNLTTTRAQVFSDVEPGTTCRICGRPVDDGRRKTCSDYCDNIQQAVMSLLNWSTVREQILERDEWQCQQCGYDQQRERRVQAHIRDRITEEVGPRPETPPLDAPEQISGEDWEAHRAELTENRGESLAL